MLLAALALAAGAGGGEAAPSPLLSSVEAKLLQIWQTASRLLASVSCETTWDT
jgi:hypothetical protein